jgi:aminoglycoside phosphotransferase family enzyme
MRKLIIIVSLCFSLHLVLHAAEYKVVRLTDKNKDFLQMMIPQVKFVNYGIKLQRRTIESNMHYFSKTGVLTNDDIHTINGIAAQYHYDKLKIETIESKEDMLKYFDGLLERVDRTGHYRERMGEIQISQRV